MSDTTETTPAPPSIVDVYLKDFAARNPHVAFKVEDENLIIEKPWGRDDTAIICSKDDHDFIAELNHVWLNPAFDAVIHCDTNRIEYLFLYVDPENEFWKSIVDQDFTVHFGGQAYNCHYAEPTTRLMEIAKRSQSMPSDEPAQTVPQLPAFRDAQRLDDISERAKKYFDGKVPRNFFIDCDADVTTIDLEALARHVNFISDFYDRRAREIVVRRKEFGTTDASKKPKRRRFLSEEFPTALSVPRMDDIILQLLEVARFSPAREAFLYYYQVFEYAGHYFVDEKVRRKLKPALFTGA